MVLFTITPLTAAQLMLMVDRYLGGHFFDTQAGGSAVIWMHFFWIFGHPEVYVLIIPGICLHLGNRSGVLAEANFRISGHGRGHRGHRVCEHERVGSPHVHGRHGVLLERILCAYHHDRRECPPASRSSTGWVPCGAGKSITPCR